MYHASGKKNPNPQKATRDGMPGRGTAATWTHQELPSYMRPVVPVFVELPYLCCFRSHHCVRPCCSLEDEQRGWCVQEGFCLVLHGRFACRATLLFQRQLWKAKACAAKWLVGSRQQLKQPEALHRLSAQAVTTLSPSSYLWICPWALATPRLVDWKGQPSPPQRFSYSFQSGTPLARSPAHRQALLSAQVPENV